MNGMPSLCFRTGKVSRRSSSLNAPLTGILSPLTNAPKKRGREAAFIAWAEYTGECNYDAFDDAYRGEAESEEDYARVMVEDNGLLNEVPEPLRSYFDFEARRVTCSAAAMCSMTAMSSVTD